MSYIFCPEKEQERIAKRFNKLRSDIEDLIQIAYEDLSSKLVVFEMFQDKMIVRDKKGTESEEDEEE